MHAVVRHLDQAQVGDVSAYRGLGDFDIEAREQLDELMLAADGVRGDELTDATLAFAFGRPGRAGASSTWRAIVTHGLERWLHRREVYGPARDLCIFTLVHIAAPPHLCIDVDSSLHRLPLTRYHARLMNPLAYTMAMPTAPSGSDGV